jgi:hypothetical protein
MSHSPEEERELGEQLDALANKSSRKFFSFSPNDVLVQVALPLVLILAIAVRLMHVALSATTQDQGPVILDLWKQQLILRIDAELDRWEKESGLAALPDFERVLWSGAWPDDPRFKQLCGRSTDLADSAQLAGQLYEQALRREPAEADASTSSYLVQLYDPLSSVKPENPESIPADFTITPERRAFALGYIEERCRTWKDQVETLQWSAVNRIARSLPLQDGITERNLQDQMKQLAHALDERGYPLLPSVIHAY